MLGLLKVLGQLEVLSLLYVLGLLELLAPLKVLGLLVVIVFGLFEVLEVLLVQEPQEIYIGTL